MLVTWVVLCSLLVYLGDFDHLTTWSVLTQAVVFGTLLLTQALPRRSRLRHAVYVWAVPATGALAWSVAVAITFVIHRRIRELVAREDLCSFAPEELALFSTYHTLAHYAPIAFLSLVTLWYQRNYAFAVRDACLRVGYIPYVVIVVGLSQIVPTAYDATKDTSEVYFGADPRAVGLVFQATSIAYVLLITRFTCHPGREERDEELKAARREPRWLWPAA